jgi:acetyltransferase-like isoleucine patch superfamily enzyme
MITFIINGIKSYIHNRHLKAIQNYITIGNSYLLNSFKLFVNFPKKNKQYLIIGDDTMLECVVTFESAEGQVIIGDRTFIGNSQIICRNNIEIGNDVFIAWGCYLYDHNSHSLNYYEREQDMKSQLNDYRAGKDFISGKNWSTVISLPIKIESNAWLGMNCIILKGVTVGEGAIVAAGSVVTKDVPAWTVVAGNPARVVKEIPEELRKK